MKRLGDFELRHRNNSYEIVKWSELGDCCRICYWLDGQCILEARAYVLMLNSTKSHKAFKKEARKQLCG